MKLLHNKEVTIALNTAGTVRTTIVKIYEIKLCLFYVAYKSLSSARKGIH